MKRHSPDLTQELSQWLSQHPEVGGWTLVAIIVTLVLGSIFGSVLVYGQISHRAGFSRWWGLLMLLPGFNWFMPIVLASSKWPVEKGRGRKPSTSKKGKARAA